MKIDHIKTSFVGGEFSPSLFGRTDIQQYDYACQIVENFLIRPYGSAISTPGSEYMYESKSSSTIARLEPFIFSRTNAYVIEVGNLYFRFYAGGDDGGIVVTTGTTPFEVAHTYTESEIWDLQFTQKNDVLWIFHPDHAPAQLTRKTASSWTLADLAFLGGPFMDGNTEATTLSVNNSSGTINITASSALFTVSGSTIGHTGSFWKIGGTRTNSTTGLEEQGYVQIDNVVSTTVVTASVINIITVTGATTSWAEGSWSAVRGWPASGAFFEGRLFTARTDSEPNKIWGSKTFVYDDFLAGAEADDGLVFALSANESNDIKWLISSNKSLVAGTYGGEFTIKSSDDSGMTPTNANAQQQASIGSEPIKPKRIGNFVYYVQRFGLKIRELFYSWDLDTYKAIDKTILSPHITGDGIVDMAYQQNPDTILWCVTTGGTIATLTREIDQEVQAWSRQVTDGYYESIAVIPSPDHAYDEVWVLVRRTIDGDTKRYVERFKNIVVPDRQDDCYYVHSGLAYSAYDATSTGTANISISPTTSTTDATITITSSTAYFSSDDVGQRIRAINSDGDTVGEVEITSYTSSTVVNGIVRYVFDDHAYDGGDWGLSVDTISGLSHLEAKTVVALADGGLDQPNKTVSSGTITLAYDYFKVIVGLPYNQTIQTLPIEGGSQRGTSQGKIQRINQVALKVNRSHLGFYIAGTEELLERVNFRDPTTLMGTPESLYTGVIANINFRDDWTYGAQVYLQNQDPLPMEVLSIISTVTTNDK